MLLEEMLSSVYLQLDRTYSKKRKEMNKKEFNECVTAKLNSTYEQDTFMI